MLWVLIRSALALLMSIHNVCFRGLIKKNISTLRLKKGLFLAFDMTVQSRGKCCFRTKLVFCELPHEFYLNQINKIRCAKVLEERSFQVKMFFFSIKKKHKH